MALPWCAIESGNVIRSHTKNSNAFLKGCAEWEKIQAVDKIMTVATEILDDLLDDDSAVIGVTGQMHGIVYHNADGYAVSLLYTLGEEICHIRAQRMQSI